ncbi:MAG: RidA family protein [Gammaproteobacteria bacterium]|nr:RidA family protein [Gammaproteobacteria bacterium]MDD9896630.1 RidA family protein [Gammaproteobacteria bacterium]MDD9958048.1 RidA family protein [Gammaproteobacteria bacterium]
MKKQLQLCSLFLLALMGTSGFAAELETEFINSSESFSQVASVSANGIKTIYVSGQVGIHNGEVPDSFAEQVDIVFSNMAGQLEAAGATMANVIKLTGFIVAIDSERLAAYSAARSKHFSSDNPPPASTLIGVSGLVLPALQVEVEAIAVIEE